MKRKKLYGFINKYFRDLLIILLFSFGATACINQRNYEHNFKLEGYLIWSNIDISPTPDEILAFNNSFDFILYKKNDIEFYKDSLGRNRIKSNNDVISVFILQNSIGTLPRVTSNSFYFNLIENTKSNFFYDFSNDSLHTTKIVKGKFLIKKNPKWIALGKYNKILNDKTQYTIIYNGLDSVKIKPIWAFNLIEILEEKLPAGASL